jgi:hypothetical protein
VSGRSANAGRSGDDRVAHELERVPLVREIPGSMLMRARRA